MPQTPAFVTLPATARSGIAIRFEGQEWSYDEFERRIAMAAAALRDAGVAPATPFAILCENRPEILVAYHAAARIGAVFISINTNLKTSEVRYVFDHSDAVLLLHDDAMAAVAAQAVPAPQCRSIDVLSAHPAAPIQEPASRDGDFMITYTSGSTGTPKAVAFNQAAEAAGNAALVELWGITPADRMVVALPLGFLYGLSTASATGLQAGCEITLLSRFHPARLLEALVSHRATIFHGVPTMYAMMLDYCEQNDLRFDLSFMRVLICAGAPLPQTLKMRFAERFGKAIDDYYALTEIRPVFGRAANETEPLPSGAIGKAAPGADIRLVDGAGREVGEGQQGEILVKAAATLTRYHKDPALTEAAMRDGYFATGDVGCRDAEGYYYITGRIKDIIIRGGANIAPAEVENILLQHDAVGAAAVIGRPDPIFGEVPVAFIVANDGVLPSEQSIVEHCRKSLADFKVPTRVHILGKLPLGATGKVDKNLLKASLEEGA